MEHTFTSEQPARLYVELGAGSLELTAGDVRTTTILLSGSGADDTDVTQDGDEIRVIAPRQRTGFLGLGTQEVHARIQLPTDSQVITRTGSADQQLSGRLRLVRAHAGSGRVRVEQVEETADLETGSGAMELTTGGADTRLKTGSGDIAVRTCRGPLAASTGSGDVTIEHAGADLAVKAGSGRVRIGTARSDVAVSTGSGDVEVDLLERGAVHAKTGSGRLRLGVAPDVPVWTDITTGSGRIHSDLVGAGEPEPGQDRLEIRARTGSGDVDLVQR